MALDTYLHDESIAIRPIRADDAQAVHDAVRESRADLAVWMQEFSSELSLADVSAYIASQPELRRSGAAYSFAILDHASASFLGECGLNQFNRRHRFANLFYWVRSTGRGRGVATRAVRLLAGFGFETLGLQRIEIVIDVGNAASMRVAEKAGALREGTLRRRLAEYDTARDAVMFSLTLEGVANS